MERDEQKKQERRRDNGGDGAANCRISFHSVCHTTLQGN